MRNSRKLAAAAALAVTAAIVAGCGSSVPSNSVASVAGNPITLQAFNHWMYVAAKDQALTAAEQGESAPVIVANDPPQFTSCIKQVRQQIPTLAKTTDSTLRTDCKQVFTEYTSEVMSFLIEGYWYQADAYKMGIRYTDAQLEKDFAKEKKAQFPTKAAYQSYLKASGETEADLKFQVRVNNLFEKLLKKYEKPVTQAAIAKYYNSHKSQFGTQESRDIHLVRTKTEAEAKAALSALNSGQSWETVAKQYSEDASAKANGGVLTGITPNEEEHAVNQAIFNNPVNKVVGPVHGIFGWYVLESTKVTPATQESLSKASATIKSLLSSQEQQSAETKVTKISKRNWGKQTTCRKLYSVADCANYVAPKTTTTTSATPTSATTTPAATSTATTGGTATTATTSTGT